MKTCSKCKIQKDFSCFSKQMGKKYNLRSRCKLCSGQDNKQYQIDNPHVISQYYENNKEKISDIKKKYYHNNKDKMRLANTEYIRNRMKNDPVFKLRKLISTTIGNAVKRENSTKRGSILKHLPYTPQQLKDHLESQFDSNMTWENHGKYWHIDHIYPQSLLPFNTMEDDNFKKCWALSNLRPLEKIQNIKKGNRI